MIRIKALIYYFTLAGLLWEIFKSLMVCRFSNVWKWCFKEKRWPNQITKHINMADVCACSLLVSVLVSYSFVSQRHSAHTNTHMLLFSSNAIFMQYLTPSPAALWPWIYVIPVFFQRSSCHPVTASVPSQRCARCFLICCSSITNVKL